MNTDIHIIYRSDFYRIFALQSPHSANNPAPSRFSGSFCIRFTHSENIQGSRNHPGFATLEKSSQSHNALPHPHHSESCTLFEFSPQFHETIMETPLQQLKAFFANNNIQSVTVTTNAEVEYLHRMTLQLIDKKNPVKIAVDVLVIELLEWFHARMSQDASGTSPDYRLHRNHLNTVEQAKNYIYTHFASDISLTGIADYCNVSPFPFARIFKNVTSYSPYQFLLDVRLRNAEYLVRTSVLAFGEICFQSGFTNMEHFNAAFIKKYGCSPNLYSERAHLLKKSRIS
jgi:AraC family transcriptional regulator